MYMLLGSSFRTNRVAANGRQYRCLQGIHIQSMAARVSVTIQKQFVTSPEVSEDIDWINSKILPINWPETFLSATVRAKAFKS